MPQRHSKNNNDLAFFTYDERRQLGYGSQKERLGRDSIKPFDACCICLKSLIDPLCCRKGHLFCKECILECLLAQKKDVKRKLASYSTQQKLVEEEELEKVNMEREQQLDAFDRQNSGAVPYASGKNHVMDRNNSFHGANSVKVTSYEAEALRTMKAFWLPSATPEAPERVHVPSTDTFCPEGKEKLKLKDLFPVEFTEVPCYEEDEKTLFMCPSCTVTLTNTVKLVAISACGHVVCRKCVDQFLSKDSTCIVCERSCKAKHLIDLEKGGTGFAGHDDQLEATTFKHLGSGTGMGLTRPAVRT